jgi:CDP-paratose 2-epimerase
VAIAVITGSCGLIGSEAARHFAGQGLDVVGVDNDMRATFFGDAASTAHVRVSLERELGHRYRHEMLDIRDREGMGRLFAELSGDVELVIHAAAQPSHDWAAQAPSVDFDINAGGTLNLLECTRKHAPEAPFIFTSTNKVYGDTPNRLPLIELDTRWELDPSHTYWRGIREDMSIDRTLHSVFGASKVAADVLVQEYGRYFGLRTVCFRGGTLTGPQHSAAELHGFLAYLVRCALSGRTYTIFGYKGKQVRDAIHSKDVISAFAHFAANPRCGAVYNLGGGRTSNTSVLEAISLVEEIVGREMTVGYRDEARIGDHIWWIGDNGSFEADYPGWAVEYDVRAILEEICDARRDEWAAAEPVERTGAATA